jgi:F0F1-type ATP synthase membrane subunit b/b'
LPALNIDGFNITPIIYYACLAIFALVGVYGKGIENIKTFFERVGLIKAEKEQKAIMKEAKKELAAEEAKVNQTQTEQEQAKAKAKAKAEAEAKAEREQAEAEHRAKIEAAKAQIIAERSTVVVAKENKDV